MSTATVTVGDVKIEGVYVITLGVSGTVRMQEAHSTARFTPAVVRVTYVIDEDDAQWECSEIHVSGPKVKRDGSASKLSGGRHFLMFAQPELPAWLITQVDAYRPAQL